MKESELLSNSALAYGLLLLPVDMDFEAKPGKAPAFATHISAMSTSSVQDVAQAQAHNGIQVSGTPAGQPETATNLDTADLETDAVEFALEPHRVHPFLGADKLSQTDSTEATAEATTAATPPDATRSLEEQVQTHRLHHTPSKLPRFRFVDRDCDSLPLQGALQINKLGKHIPAATSPASPATLPLLPSHSLARVDLPAHKAVSHAAPPAGIDSTFAPVDTAQHSDHIHPQNPSTKPQISTACSCCSHWSPAQPSPSPRTAAAPRPSSAPVHALASSSVPPPLTPVTEADEPHSITCTADDTDAKVEDEITLAADHQNSSRLHKSAASPTSLLSPHSTALSLEDHHSPLSQGSTYRTASTSSPITLVVAKKPASFRTGDTATTASSIITAARTSASTVSAPAEFSSSPAVIRSNSDTDFLRFYNPATRPPFRRASSLGSTVGLPNPKTKEWTYGQRELLLPRAVKQTHTNANDTVQTTKSATSRPQLSLTPPTPGPTTPGRIPPIHSSRSSRSRRSTIPTMANSSYRYYDDGGDYRDSNNRDRSLRALEGRPSNDRAPSTEADEEQAESGDNTADIFMRIAREDSASILPRPKQNDGLRGDEQTSTPVSSVFLILVLSIRCGRRRDEIESQVPYLHKFTALQYQ